MWFRKTNKRRASLAAILGLVLSLSLASCSPEGTGTSSSAEEAVRTLDYKGYSFVYLEDSRGRLMDSSTEEVLLEMDDVSFDVEALMNLEEGTPFLDSVDSIGFPNSVGTYKDASLDFVSDGEYVYRVFFSKVDRHFLSFEKLEGERFTTWVDESKGFTVTMDDVSEIDLGMRLHEVGACLGKADGITGSGIPCLYYFIEDGWTFCTYWRKFSSEDDAWRVYSMAYYPSQDVESGFLA